MEQILTTIENHAGVCLLLGIAALILIDHIGELFKRK